MIRRTLLRFGVGLVGWLVGMAFVGAVVVGMLVALHNFLHEAFPP